MAQLTGAADWFKLRVPYDCSSLVHYYQLQGAFWKDNIGKIELNNVEVKNILKLNHLSRGESEEIHGETGM